MDGENNGKTLLKLMIWGYHYFWKHPYYKYHHQIPLPETKSFQPEN